MAWRKVWKQRRDGNRRNIWLLRWYDDAGRMRARTFHGSERQAEDECHRVEGELNEGSLGQRRKIGWLNFCEEFLEDLASHRRPRTVDDYRKALAALTAYCKPQYLDELTAPILRKFVREQTEGRAPATRNKLIRTLRAVLGWAVPDYLKENPAIKVRFASEPEIDKRVLAPEELVRMGRVADARGQAVLLLGSCCGFRRGEIAALQWTDVDPQSGKIHVRNSEWHITKSGQQRAVLMPPDLIALLETTKALSKSPFVFPEVYLSYHELPNAVRKEWSRHYRKGLQAGLGRKKAREVAWQAVRTCQKPDRPIDPDRLTDLIPRLARKAKVEHCTLHDLRRTFCTYLAACGTDPLAAQKLAGHSSPNVTAKDYVRIVSQTLKAQEQLPFWNLRVFRKPDDDKSAA